MGWAVAPRSHGTMVGHTNASSARKGLPQQRKSTPAAHLFCSVDVDERVRILSLDTNDLGHLCTRTLQLTAEAPALAPAGLLLWVCRRSRCSSTLLARWAHSSSLRPPLQPQALPRWPRTPRCSRCIRFDGDHCCREGIGPEWPLAFLSLVHCCALSVAGLRPALCCSPATAAAAGATARGRRGRADGRLWCQPGHASIWSGSKYGCCSQPRSAAVRCGCWSGRQWRCGRWAEPQVP
jgi:hypothetical protein